MTDNVTKCMIRVNGVSLIERLLIQLKDSRINDVIIVIGYLGDVLQEFIESLSIGLNIHFVENEDYNITNNIYSVYLCKEFLQVEDILLIESDLILDDSIIPQLLTDERKNVVLVDKWQDGMSGTIVLGDEHDRIVQMVEDNKRKYYVENLNCYKTVNIYKLSREFCKDIFIPLMDYYISLNRSDVFYESIFQLIVCMDCSLLVIHKLLSNKWYEIDTEEDLKKAKELFSNVKRDALNSLIYRYGGYWKDREISEYLFMSNPYFPSKSFIKQIQENLPQLIAQYPSGTKEILHLIESFLNINKKYLIVGNGASELSCALFKHLDGEIGYITPTFLEYPNRHAQKQNVYFDASNKNFDYDAMQLIDFFSKSSVQTIVLVNPNNPTGFLLSRYEIFELLEWAKANGIRLVVDESFIDFTDEYSSILENSIIESYPQLIIIKSISKSYGIPGLRMGILACSDQNLLNKVQGELPIWNINAICEFFLENYNQYHKEYLESIEKIKKDRREFIEKLRKLNRSFVFPSQGNFVLIELEGRDTADKVQKELFERYNILIKNETYKINGKKSYIRIALKDRKENDKLLQVFKSVLM